MRLCGKFFGFLLRFFVAVSLDSLSVGVVFRFFKMTGPGFGGLNNIV